jgi:hypothetical protein
MSSLIGFCCRREQIGPIHVVRFVQVSSQGAAEGRPFPCDKAHFLNRGAPKATLAAPPCGTCHIYKGLKVCIFAPGDTANRG